MGRRGGHTSAVGADPGLPARRRREQADLRLEQFWLRAAQLLAGIPPTAQDAERARDIAEFAQARADTAHLRAAESHRAAAEPHDQAAKLHEHPAQSSTADPTKTVERAEGHRAGAQAARGGEAGERALASEES
jgi:hypothetical protein